MSFSLGIEVTRSCNFSCRHCFVDAGRGRQEEGSTAAFVGLIEQVAASGIDSIGWSGGEPLLRRDLPQLTACAASLGIRVGLATNGYRATARRLEGLKQAGLGVVQVSLDAPDPERSTRYRRGPAQHFARAVEAVRAGVGLGLQTYLCTLLSPETMAEAAEMVAFARELGVRGLRYTMWAPVGRARSESYDEARWQSAALDHFVAAIGPYSRGGPGFRVLVDCPTGPLPWSRRHSCGAGRLTAYVTARGDLYPCTALLFPEYRVGNVFETRFDRLFNEGRMFKVLREVARLPAGGFCGTCSLTLSCRGGCPGRTVAAFGRLRKGRGRHPVPVCLYGISQRRRGEQAS